MGAQRSGGRNTVISVGGRELEISSRDKTFFPDAGLTKGDLVDYYARTAAVMLPHVRGRCLTLQRFPDGLDGDGFYQKNASAHFPDWIRTVEVEKEGGTVRHVVADEPATLVYLADQGCVTLHAWTSRVDRLRVPDRLVFDFDPPDGRETFRGVVWAARVVGARVREFGLTPFVQTSGSRGLHIHVPLAGDDDFDTVRAVARALADGLVDEHPQRLTTRHRKAKRGDRIFIDVLRNGYAQTAVVPYSVRPRPGAPVATPLDWSELGRSDLSPTRYTLENLHRRLARKPDPWAAIDDAAASLDEARVALGVAG